MSPRGEIDVLDTGSLKEVASIGNVSCPEGLFAATRKPLLFAVTQGGLGNDSLYVIDTRKDKVIRTIPGFATGSQVLATADGGTVFVPTDDGLKMVRNYLAIKPEIKTIGHFVGVSAMALTNDQRTLIVARSYETGSPTQGEIVSFDARTGKPCPNKPILLKTQPPSFIAIGPHGTLMSPRPLLPILTGDSRALECRVP